MNPSVLSGRGLVKSFRQGRVLAPVLHGLSLDIAAHELTLISGPSGCGKSTLLAALGGLLRPDAGEVQAEDGALLWRLSPTALERYRLQHTGFVFQGFNLFGALTALEQVMLPLGYLGLGRHAAHERALEALAQVGLQERAGLRPAQLSGGEKQRVAIARAIAKRPRLLFADEPTSALDAENGQRVIRILHHVARRQGTAVLCVSHDPRLALHADRLLHMEDGRLIDDVRQAPDTTALAS